ncbi:integrase [Vibrio cyclitrophicus]|uniref:integrase n=1 Tax=Vibrio cyclitrophicus TaxID=47951 RepID=UPI00031F2982|nr:integrase [Vibrio cyclitrophicus]OED99573.1 integrase [Vibrio cyclitrophicus ZF28]PMF17035.1 integrase [Vibrio cyclitrophicus]PMG84779.1 integrase [Vibrio cyclitrophicus]PMJ50473.1 integrase [Vibrio cyclitrophicus]
MVGRARSKETAHYPPFLVKMSHRGQSRFRFTTVDGVKKLFPIGTVEQEAIQAAHVYNLQYRPELGSAFSLSEMTPFRKAVSKGRKDKFNRPLKEWLPLVLSRVKKEERLSKDVYRNLERDCYRLDEFMGRLPTKSIKLQHINEFLSEYYSELSNRQLNNKISNLKKVFSYLADESAIESNFVLNKKQRRLTREDYTKARHDLDIENYQKIYDAAPLFLKVAMSLTLETTHAVREIYRLRYRIYKPREGVCGILWNPDKEVEYVEGHAVYGMLYVHREKVKKSDASTVAIPVTQTIKDIVDLSKTSRLICPYIVHRKPKQQQRGISKETDHLYQVHHHNISKEFSKVRDSLGLYSHLKKSLRPTYHEIRGLAARMIEQQGQSATERMAHANAKTTKIYTGTSDIIWHQVPPVEVMPKSGQK